MAFEGFADQPGGCRPNYYLQPMVQVLVQAAVDFARPRPIAGLVVHQARQVGTPVGAHLAAVAHLLGWGDHWWAAL